MSSKNMKPVALAVGALMLGGVALSQSAFAMTPLAQGYQQSVPDGEGDKPTEGKCGEGKCGAGMMGGAGAAAAGEGKCGEGKCGMGADTNKDGKVSAAEHAAHAEARFKAADANHDGMVSAEEMKAMHEGKCGEGKCGEGKCGAGH